jgi:hypothetical protein
MTVRIYVAGASKEPERCRAAMTAVQKLGLEITLDWLAAIEAEGAANEGLDDEKRVRYSTADLLAVTKADWVWVLAPALTSSSAGCWVELGYALGLRDTARWMGDDPPLFVRGPRIIVSGPGRVKCIFCSLAEREFDDDVAALAYLNALRGAGRSHER